MVTENESRTVGIVGAVLGLAALLDGNANYVQVKEIKNSPIVAGSEAIYIRSFKNC